MSARDAWYVIRDVAQALTAMHDANLVFRDLTPNNVLVSSLPGTERPQFCLCDLESACRLSVSRPPVNDGMTGTSGFMAHDLYYTGLSDAWQLGLLLLACRSGTMLPSGDQLRRIEDIHRHEVWGSLEPEEQELLEACCADLNKRRPPALIVEQLRYFTGFMDTTKRFARGRSCWPNDAERHASRMAYLQHLAEQGLLTDAAEVEWHNSQATDGTAVPKPSSNPTGLPEPSITKVTGQPAGRLAVQLALCRQCLFTSCTRH